MTLFRVTSEPALYSGAVRIGRCALGAAGVVAGSDKQEGDQATPAGTWPLRRVLYRPDREAPPLTRLALAPLAPEDGWCDEAGPLYNRAVTLPCRLGHEQMWRDDHCYDFVIVLGQNDAPAVAGRGSAIFVHLAREGYAATEGCIALSRPDMLTMLLHATGQSAVEVVGR